MADKFKATWVSHSSIGDFLECPRLYYLHNVYKNPDTGRKISVINPYMSLGTAVHNVLEGLVEFKAEERMNRSLVDLFKEEWKKVAKEKKVDKSLIDLWTTTWARIENASVNNSVENVLLTAEALGIGCCYAHSCNLAEKQIKEILKIPEKLYMHGIICLGVPDEAPKLKPRRKIENFVYFNEYK